tara:strand:+ start:123 stop:1046 length:924 start_codon:yes stop_codon:yes gene_type:complete
MSKKKILILGGSGLVGSSLTRHFNNKNDSYQVFSSTRKDADLFNIDDTYNLISNFNPDILINAAAKVGGIYANNTYRTNFIIENLKINLNVLESCIKFPNIKIINLGSSCIYPLNAKNPIKEVEIMNGKLEPTNSPYAMAKLTAIEIANAMNLEHGHKIINLMPTNLYGPNDNFSEKESHVIPGLIARMHKAKINSENEFEVWGSGEALREFLFVDDLSNCIEYIINKNINEDLINVGSGDEISIKNLAKKISEIIEYSGNLLFDDSKPSGNPRKMLDSSIINSYGWESETNLDLGLEKTYKWFLDK